MHVTVTICMVNECLESPKQWAGKVSSDACMCALAAVAVILLTISPVMADKQYMAGSPELDAHIAGLNSFYRETMSIFR